ncbi:anthranilate synthase [Nocardiopsis arvandica]|uniref:Anthranilate synthase n=1 Tax=Nocardiopsis sinuspersici TaxID=501010 RepID=A0A7Z0BKA7_9ACTN|nr:anthranilate synthase [Nocardiopsis sinuspersici]
MNPSDVQTTTYRTQGGVTVHRSATPCDPEVLAELVRSVEYRRGGVLSSGMEYPGRYDRWHLGYVDPCLEITTRGRAVTATALNDRGRVLLPVLAGALYSAGVPDPDDATADPGHGRVAVTVPEPDPGAFFTEEERSRRPSVFTALRAVLAALHSPEDTNLGLYGAFGYDLAFQFEPIERHIDRDPDDRDLVLHLPDAVIVRDRKRETCVRYTYDFTVPADGDRAGATTRGLPRETELTPPVVATEVPEGPEPGSYARVVAKAKEKFRRGDLFEVVPGHRTYARCSSPARFYELLRERNPAPYEFFFNLGGGEYLVGASPEMFVRVSGEPGTGQRVETCPISGTIRRGEDALGDAENIQELLSSVKEKSELTMCTDVDRNDKSRVCEPGSVRVIGRRQIEMYSRLIHTVDHIEGTLRRELDALDAFLTHMWAVTVTGAPKTWAMRFIEQNETSPRRWYGGAVGVLNFDGSMNTGLTLRTAHIRDGVAAVRAGATLLYDSDPEAEEKETFLKARALLETLALGERIGEREEGAGSTEEADAAPAELPGRGMRVLLVDHEDSFVNTLADYVRRHGAEVTTVRYGFDASLLDRLSPDLVVLSPGPGLPVDFGMSALLDELAARRLPVFGVCLGLQGMVEYAGGELRTLDEPVHGKPGRVRVSGGELLTGLDGGDAFPAARYHSTYTVPDLVKRFEVTAVLDGEAGEEPVVMAVEDPAARWYAVQFHPESILTAAVGEGIVAQALRLARG